MFPKCINHRYILDINVTFEGRDCTLHSCIARESNWTRTDWFVINGLTDGIDTADADAGISTLLREASLVTRTI